MKKLISVIVLFIFASSCAGMSDRLKTILQGTGAGAATGAAAGAVIGKIAGGDTKDALKGAAIGAVTGAIAGYAYGTHVANKKEEYATEEDYLNACIDAAHQVNEETENYNATLRGELTELNEEINILVEQYNSKQIAKEDLLEKQKTIQEKQDEVNKVYERVTYEIKEQRGVLEREKDQLPEKEVELEHEVENLEKQKTEIEEHVLELASVNERINL